jgi:hypothetical protein
VETDGRGARWPARGSRRWLPAAVAVYLLGIAVIVAFAVTTRFDSWLDFPFFALWALIPGWITAGIAARMGWGPREIATEFRAPGRR